MNNNYKYIATIYRLNKDRNSMREEIENGRWKEKRIRELSEELSWYQRILEVIKVIKDNYPYSVNCEPIKLIGEFCW